MPREKFPDHLVSKGALRTRKCRQKKEEMIAELLLYKNEVKFLSQTVADKDEKINALQTKSEKDEKAMQQLGVQNAELRRRITDLQRIDPRVNPETSFISVLEPQRGLIANRRNNGNRIPPPIRLEEQHDSDISWLAHFN